MFFNSFISDPISSSKLILAHLYQVNEIFLDAFLYFWSIKEVFCFILKQLKFSLTSIPELISALLGR